MAENVVPVIQNQAILLVRLGRQAGAAPHHLDEKPRRVGRAQKHDAIGVRGVKAGGEHIHVGQVLQRLLRRPEQVVGNRFTLEARDDFRALRRGRGARHDGTFAAGQSGYLVSHVLTVFDRTGENEDGLAVDREHDDFPACGGHELLLVHRRGHFLADEFAAADVQVLQLRLDPPGFGYKRREVLLLNHLLESRLVADRVEDVLRLADEAALHAKGRRRQPNHAEGGVDDRHVLQEGPVHSVAIRRDQVGFINNDNVEGAQIAGLVVHALDACHDDILARVTAFQSCRVNAHLEFRT